jgi:hypothetical protein
MSSTSGSFLLDQSPIAAETGSLGIYWWNSKQGLCATETNLANAQPLIHADKNYAYSIVKNIQVHISLFRRYV